MDVLCLVVVWVKVLVKRSRVDVFIVVVMFYRSVFMFLKWVIRFLVLVDGVVFMGLVLCVNVVFIVVVSVVVFMFLWGYMCVI